MNSRCLAIVVAQFAFVAYVIMFDTLYDPDDPYMDSTCDYVESSYVLAICSNGAMDGCDMVKNLAAPLINYVFEIEKVILLKESLRINDMAIDTDEATDVYIIKALVNEDHKTITMTGADGAGRVHDLVDDVLTKVHSAATSINTVISTK